MSKTTFDALEPQPYKVNVTLEVACDSNHIQRTTGKLARYIDGLPLPDDQRGKLVELVQEHIKAVEQYSYSAGFSLGVDYGRDTATNDDAEQED